MRKLGKLLFRIAGIYFEERKTPNGSHLFFWKRKKGKQKLTVWVRPDFINFKGRVTPVGWRVLINSNGRIEEKRTLYPYYKELVKAEFARWINKI